MAIGCILIASILLGAAEAQPGGLCNVFEPFKVQPENSNYQIGGPFALHEDDCIFLRPERVQELIAIQWALTHWNQNPSNSRSKLALNAFDTCSRRREVVRRSLEFLQKSGFYRQQECTPENDGPQLLGLLAPRDNQSSAELADFVRALQLPVGAYSMEAIQALKTHGVQFAFTTEPALDQYLEAAIHVARNLRSNLVTLVGNSKTNLDEMAEILQNNGLTVAEKHKLNLLETPYQLATGQADIIITILEKRELHDLLRNREVKNSKKLFITLPASGQIMTTDQMRDMMLGGGVHHVITLQRYQAELSEFKDYFLGVVKNNYRSFSLLATYMQQVYNCSLIGTPGFVQCQDLTKDYMSSEFSQAPGVESAVLATYAYAQIGATLGRDAVALENCLSSSEKCADHKIRMLRGMDYQFGEFDPMVFDGFRLQFEQRDGYLSAKTLLIQGTHLVHNGNVGLMAQKVVDFATGSQPSVHLDKFYWPDGEQIKSQCTPFKTSCNPCPSRIDAELDRFTLSLPRTYDLYIAGMFDLNQGSSCLEPAVSRQIYMPMAFIHTLVSVKERYPGLNLLPNVDVGALVIDSCSSTRAALQAASELETSCLLLQYENKNVTIAPESLVALVSGGDAEVMSSILDRNSFSLITQSVDLEAQAYALVRLLQMLNWDHVTALVSKTDIESRRAFERFEKVAIQHDLCVDSTIEIPTNFVNTPNTRVSVVFATPMEFASFAQDLPEDHGALFVLTGDAHDWEIYAAYDKKKLLGSVSLQPKQLLRSDFLDFFEQATAQNFPEVWYLRFIEQAFNCAILPEHQVEFNGRFCSGRESLRLEDYGRMSKAAYLTENLENFVFALDSVYKTHCPALKGLCDAFLMNGKRDIQRFMENRGKGDASFELYNYRLGSGGVTEYIKIGNYSNAGGLRLIQNHIWYEDGQASNLPVTSTCKPPLCKCTLGKTFFTNPLQEQPRVAIDTQPAKAHRPIKNLHNRPPARKVSLWENRLLAWIFVGVTTLLLLCAIAVLTLVTVKLYMRVVKGNQSLGICLLCGVILLYSTTYFYILEPSDFICRMRYIAHSVAYALCFGVMIAKATQLRNSETIGYNGYVSYWNYWLLLAFILGVQMALNVHWMLAKTSVLTHVFQGQSTALRCSWSFKEFLLSQSYPVILLLLALCLALLNRNIKRNYKETKWLLWTTMLCTPIWLFWMLTYAFVPELYKDVVLVLELLACATVILCFMFGPKVYILLSYEPVLVEIPAGYKIAGAVGTGTGDMFERDDFDDTAGRATSPASSGGSTRSTNLSQADGSVGEQSPVFQAVVRKKSRSKRMKVQNENREIAAHMMPKSTPYVLSPMHRPAYPSLHKS